MFYVILDSNIIFDNWFFDKTNFSKLIDYAHYAPVNIILPETVLDEIKARYKDGFDRYKERLDGALTDLHKYLGDDMIVKADLTYENLDKRDIGEAYGEFLLNKIKNLDNFLILPYPKIKPKDIFTRALLQKKPFKPTKLGQSGFRDYIVWSSILDLLKVSQMGTFIYLTKNKDDFYDDDLQNIDSDIQADLDAVSMVNKEFFIFESLSDFYVQYEDIITRFVAEKVSVDDYENALKLTENGLNESKDFMRQVKSLIKNTYNEWLPEVEPKHLKVNHSHVVRRPITVMGLHEVYNIDKLKVHTFDFNCYYITGKFQFKVDLRYEVDKADYWKAHKIDELIPEPNTIPNRENYYLLHTTGVTVEVNLKYIRSDDRFECIEGHIIPEPKSAAGLTAANAQEANAARHRPAAASAAAGAMGGYGGAGSAGGSLVLDPDKEAQLMAIAQGADPASVGMSSDGGSGHDPFDYEFNGEVMENKISNRK